MWSFFLSFDSIMLVFSIPVFQLSFYGTVVKYLCRRVCVCVCTCACARCAVICKCSKVINESLSCCAHSSEFIPWRHWQLSAVWCRWENNRLSFKSTEDTDMQTSRPKCSLVCFVRLLSTCLLLAATETMWGIIRETVSLVTLLRAKYGIFSLLFSVWDFT